MTSLDGAVNRTVVDGVGHLQISRVGRANALSVPMWQALPEAVAELATHPDVRLIAIRGAGGTFSAGADLRDVLKATTDPDRAARYCALVAEALSAVAHAPVTTAALVEGTAVGGGAELALAADLRVMASAARLSLPLAGLGVVPDRLTVRRLLQLAGPATARRLLLVGAQLGAEECLRTGLVDRVVTAGELPAAAADLAGRLAAAPPGAVRAIKAALVAEEGIGELAGLTERMRDSFLSGGVAARASAFLPKTLGAGTVPGGLDWTSRCAER